MKNPVREDYRRCVERASESESMLIPVATLDAAMLIAETAEMPLHNLGVLLFEPPPDSAQSAFESMHAMIAARLHRVPAFRRKLVQGPLRLGDLHWVEDTEVDLGRHLFRARLPAPGGEAELRAFVGDYAARLLPRDKPLWEVALVEGLASGELAAVAKIHHATMDGSKLAALLGDLFDHDPNDAALEPPPQAQRVTRDPGVIRLALAGAQSLAEKPGRVTRAALDVASALMRRRGASSGSDVPEDGASFGVPRTPWGGALSTRRVAAFAHVSLSDVRAIGAAFDATINDVVLAAAASTLRRWLIARGALPATALIANVPVAVSDEHGDHAGNHVSMLRVHLPMDELDPVSRLRRIHAETSRGKRHHRRTGANPYLRLADLVLGITVPRALNAAVSFYARHRGADLHPALWNVVISNVPGPRAPLYCHGARLARIHPLGPVQHGSGLNLTVMSTGDQLGLGVLACGERVSHADDIALGFAEEVAVLLAASACARTPASS